MSGDNATHGHVNDILRANLVMAPDERGDRRAGLASARAALGDEECARIWAEGQAMTLDQAVAFGLQDASAGMVG